MRREALVVAAMTLVLAGCGKNKSLDETQIAAQVNKGEISVHQVQAVLQRQPKLMAKTNDEAASQVLEVLIDQELAAQAAAREGLESDPSVVQSLQLARREALARAYHDRIVANAAAPASDEIDRYYAEHPALFAQRRLYSLQEFAVEANAEQLVKVRDVVANARSADSVGSGLRELGVRFSARQLAQAAEDVPLGLLEMLSGASVGQSVLVPQMSGARVFTVLHIQPASVDRRMASEAISRFLVAEQKRKLVSKTMTELRKDGQVRYVGSFSKNTPTAAAAPAQQAASSGR